MDFSRLTSLLSELERCGVYLAADARVEDLAAELPEDADVLDVLCILGDECGRSGRPWSEDIWHCDPERIGGDGDIVDVAERMRDIARGDLPLEAIEDRVREKECWLTFVLDGKRYHWDVEWNEDWMDPTVLERFGLLLAARDTGRKFTYCDPNSRSRLGEAMVGSFVRTANTVRPLRTVRDYRGSQDFLIGCATPAQLQRLKQVTGLEFQWLVLKKGSGLFSGSGVSTEVVRVDAKPDILERNIKFGCGALVGFVLGFFLSIRILPRDLRMMPSAWVLVGLIVAVIFGRKAMRY